MIQIVNRIFRTLTGAEKAEQARRIAALYARIDELNEQPVTPERNQALEDAIWQLGTIEDGVHRSGVWAGTRLKVLHYSTEEAREPQRKPLADPRRERLWQIDTMLRLLSGGNATLVRNHQLPPECVREVTGLSEHRALAVGIRLEEERSRLAAELAAERTARLDADFEAFREEARGKAAHLAELEAKLLASIAKLLPLEAEYSRALQACRAIAERQEHLILTEPTLHGRRVATPVGPSASIPTAPGHGLLHLARKAAEPPALRVAK